MSDVNKTHRSYVSPWLKRISRISAWALLISVFILVFSGWGITQTGVIYRFSFGLIDRRIADAIHRDMNLPLAIFFLTHVLVNIKISITQSHPSKPWLTNAILGLIGLGLLVLVIYMEFIRLGG